MRTDIHPQDDTDNDVTARVLALARRTPSSPAILAPGREPLSFAALAEQIHRVAATFARLGIERGDVVAWANDDRAQTAAALAAMPVSCTLAPLNPASTPAALHGLLQRTRARAVVVPAEGEPAIVRAARSLDVTELVAVPAADWTAGAFELAVSRATASLASHDRLRPAWAVIGATSGATGRPKLVPHGHRQIVATARATGERLAIGPGDVSGHLMPLHLAGGMRNAFFQAILNGAAVNVLPLADTAAFVTACADGLVSFASASFTMWRELLSRVGQSPRFERGRLRFVRVASGRLEAEEMDRLEALLGVPVVTGLASSETGTTAQQPLPPAPRKRGSVGPAVDTEIRLVGDDGRVVGDGAIGEVQVRGPQLFDGYVDDPSLDAASFVDGWFRMGDLGRFDEDGELYLVGRIKEVINRGGDKIAPLEIDAVLRGLPGVADAAAFGVPHPRLGEEVVAAVVPEAGARIDEDALLARARDALGANRSPRRIYLVGSLPRTDGGKLRRGDLPGVVGFESPAPGTAPAATSEPSQSPIEHALRALWVAALGVAVVPRDADFFALGGDAQRADRLIHDVHAAFGVELAANALRGEASTLARMASRISKLCGDRRP